MRMDAVDDRAQRALLKRVCDINRGTARRGSQYLFGLLSLCACLLFTACGLATSAAIADQSKATFPGRGSRAQWDKGNELYSQANKLARENHLAQSLPLYRQAIAAYPYDVAYFKNMGGVLQRLGNYAGAESAGRSAAQLAPNDWEIWENIANAQHGQNKLEQELEAFDRALALHPPKKDVDRMERLKFGVEWQISTGKSADAMAKRK